MSVQTKSPIALTKPFVAAALGAGLFLALPMGCETSPKEEAKEAVDAVKRGDMKQAVEETGETVSETVKDITK